MIWMCWDVWMHSQYLESVTLGMFVCVILPTQVEKAILVECIERWLEDNR